MTSASRRARKTGAVPVFGFTRAKSSAVSGKQRSASAMASVSCRKKAQCVSANVRSSPPQISAQNLNEACTSLKKIFLFSKSNRPGDAPARGDGFEEGGRGLVGVDAGRRE